MIGTAWYGSTKLIRFLTNWYGEIGTGGTGSAQNELIFEMNPRCFHFSIHNQSLDTLIIVNNIMSIHN